MTLHVIGAGLPRTGTNSLGIAVTHLFGGRYHHMSVIPGHPFDLGDTWDRALRGERPDFSRELDGYVAAVDWPASMFWADLAVAYPEALVVLSVRDSARTWWESASRTFLPYARMAGAPDWTEGRGLADLVERFAGTPEWDDPDVLMDAYDRHTYHVRSTAPADRFLEWRPDEGWAPLCGALGMPVPDAPFPWASRREDWG